MNNPNGVEAGQLWYDKEANALYLILRHTGYYKYIKEPRWELVCLSDCKRYEWHVGKVIELQEGVIKRDQYVGKGF
jgi:hypothetical protein